MLMKNNMNQELCAVNSCNGKGVAFPLDAKISFTIRCIESGIWECIALGGHGLVLRYLFALALTMDTVKVGNKG